MINSMSMGCSLYVAMQQVVTRRVAGGNARPGVWTYGDRLRRLGGVTCCGRSLSPSRCVRSSDCFAGLSQCQHDARSVLNYNENVVIEDSIPPRPAARSHAAARSAVAGAIPVGTVAMIAVKWSIH